MSRRLTNVPYVLLNSLRLDIQFYSFFNPRKRDATEIKAFVITRFFPQLIVFVMWTHHVDVVAMTPTEIKLKDLLMDATLKRWSILLSNLEV